MIRDTVSERIGSVIQAVADYAILEAEGLETGPRSHADDDPLEGGLRE